MQKKSVFARLVFLSVYSLSSSSVICINTCYFFRVLYFFLNFSRQFDQRCSNTIIGNINITTKTYKNLKFCFKNRKIKKIPNIQIVTFYGHKRALLLVIVIYRNDYVFIYPPKLFDMTQTCIKWIKASFSGRAVFKNSARS